VAPGNENGLRLRIYGDKGGLEWRQEHPNQLHWSPFGQPTQIISRGTGAASADAARVTRLPSGHPEGYLEGFASVYAEIAQALRAARDGSAIAPDVVFPTIEDGVHGMAFIEAAVRSSAQGGQWVGVAE
jgi:predicted dehydrogenase